MGVFAIVYYYGEDILLFTEEDYCLYPDCTGEKEFDGAQFCSEDHLDQASDEGRFITLHFHRRWRVRRRHALRNVSIFSYITFEGSTTRLEHTKCIVCDI